MVDLRLFSRATNPNKTLDISKAEDSNYYIDFSPVRVDVLKNLKKKITFFYPDEATCSLFTGHIGCGKSTELLRLKYELEQEGFQVIYFESDRDLEITDVDIADILLVISRRIIEELEAAREYFEQNGQSLEVEVKANLNALLGFTKRFDGKWNQAVEYYQEAREGYQVVRERLLKNDQYELTEEGLKIRQGYLLKELVICYYFQKNCKEACDSLQEMLQVFKEVKRQDLVFISLNVLGNILKNLVAWELLESLANEVLQLNQEGIAEAYLYLAEVAFARSQWETVLDLTKNARESESLSRVYFLQAKAQEELKQFTDAVESLEAAKALCLHYLSSSGRDESISVFNVRKINEDLYINILENLQNLYFVHLKDYTAAFDIKQAIVEAKQRFGQYAFIGANRIKNTALLGQSSGLIAPEIVASGREKDVENLVEKIVSKHYKVIVIYGESGVGKSSLVSGGLVPCLQDKVVSDGTILPIYLRVYADWLAELERQLGEIKEIPPTPLNKGCSTVENSLNKGGYIDKNYLGQGCSTAVNSLEKGDYATENENKFPPLLRGARGDREATILERLERCKERHRVVFIFDQFEEFFFEKTTTKEQHEFFEFLGECLKILSLKIIFCLRKDYLHYLVDVPGMDSISNDILSKDNLYKIGDFEPEETKEIIQCLTQPSQFRLACDLIDQLVIDLTEDDRVRPIELQIVGAQLQQENITTLEKYRSAGTKEELVQKYLYGAVQACGEENEEIGNLILYLLTDERGTRPLKTRKELVAELTQFKALAQSLTIEESQLDLVLGILEKSGLVVLIPEKPSNRYQLLHDYLTRVIRGNNRSPKTNKIWEKYKNEKERRQALENLLTQLKMNLKTMNVEFKVLKQSLEQAKDCFKKENQTEKAERQILEKKLNKLKKI